ncbi:hypothetical protein IV203_017004 [Nitzschia inconspicua]|uniref:Uncharacterized protein n=1 Tax=Nitzschia inconspicua TaxID=303405 RepID=A0A9K3PKI5_9STRA|nr:hypothetical protein IV203_017004 [Nitzschia inconspicua]
MQDYERAILREPLNPSKTKGMAAELDALPDRVFDFDLVYCGTRSNYRYLVYNSTCYLLPFTAHGTMAESKCKGKAKKFNLEWIVKYGLEVSTRDPSTSEVNNPKQTVSDCFNTSLKRNQPVYCTPSMEWWLVVIIIQGLVERIEKTISAMQGTRTLVCEQRQLLTALKHDIKERCYIKGPMTDEKSISFLAAVNNDPLNGFHLNNYCVLRQEVASSIDEVGSFVQLTMDGLRSSSSDEDKETHDCIISTTANFSLQLVSGISKVCAERDNRNNSGDH